MKYRIVKAKSAEKLMQMVNELMYERWKPIGGVSVCASYSGAGNIYCQAMVYLPE